ncbi:MAG: transcription-repair coupling factor [Bacteroidetes bacterium GWE2_41_25]|nr:MAG: transcription-repair coupling factor [Bacteroidetes bacterium GWC2_40_22]OFY04393.1 MAG: transcription-repair coupling factor [Bacteroidetes bacterium GWE2_41_25]OFY57584.1 MAG: transcription-repair coupling factor [Bacteroidetes bacterium GWF2_41_9]HAM08955.1 transcription-repair coupling factor [Bacteroidales bacterium]HBH84406.1 transcription-repair coupling factor [Bacteroidales bacterium]
MKENKITDHYNLHPVIPSLLESVNSDQFKNIGITGLSGSSKAMILSLVFHKTQCAHVVVIPEKEDAAYFYNDLVSLLGEDSVFFFPSTYKRSVQYEQTEPANIVLRTEVLNFLASGKRKGIIVTYPESAMEKVISRRNLKKNTFNINKGDRLSLEFLEEILREYNFTRTDFVYEPGQYAIRGGIADVFSYSADLPYRIDFFGEEAETIRSFNTDDQLSVSTHKQISIIPNIQDLSIEEINDSFTDFLPPSSVIWIEEAAYIKEKINNIFFQTTQREESGHTSDKKDRITTGNDFLEQCRRFRMVEFGRQSLFQPDARFEFRTELQPVFNKNFDLLASRLLSNDTEGYSTYIISESESQIERLRDIFSEINPEVGFNPLLINLHSGFTDHDLKIAVFTDHQIFDRYHKFRIRGYFTKKESISVKELTGLNPGDYVVHIDHGIGKFGGLEKIEVNGKIQEAIKLVYRDNDILYVGIHSLHRISKYKGKDNSEPKIYKLGSGAWQKLKQSTKARVKDIAKDLILLYAKRMSSPGYSFSPDSYLQRELEASFIYEDTPDQLTASVTVKGDMEAEHPMDRLVCGDVGFGKTEIAIRAAFKSASDSKQTAVLVPTTILALQHYKTFSSRLKGYPCNIEYISRHKKAADQKKILAALAEGRIDIIIGTHKLVGQDVKFKDLGLLVIDEEQRFGVSVKEKLKKLKANVDTLTLTATPIPRTLQFSLMGARDLSIINTPPPNRMPIVTELHGYNEEIIKEGIEYEVARNGQVFFIHNRVENIKQIQAHINRICPNVKTAIVHGQMDGPHVENVMFDFIQGDYDVLIATTIIESGLDIPNANTIFINDAHHFGLSELHQLRGRVGRSNRKAFCYLLAPPLTTLTHEARRRLKAIEEYSELGSGFNIAMQDLDIRGSGNLLGGEQSGFIADVGFETYQRILNEAMLEIRESDKTLQPAEPVKTETGKEGGEKQYVSDFQIDTDLEIMFPDEYVSNISERIRLYKELNEIGSNESLELFAKKLIDRFGPIPPTAEALLDIVRIKWIAGKLGIEKILLKNNLLIAFFISDQKSPFYRTPLFVSIMNHVNRNHKQMTMKQKKSKLSLTISDVRSVKAAIKVLNEFMEL